MVYRIDTFIVGINWFQFEINSNRLKLKKDFSNRWENRSVSFAYEISQMVMCCSRKLEYTFYLCLVKNMAYITKYLHTYVLCGLPFFIWGYYNIARARVHFWNYYTERYIGKRKLIISLHRWKLADKPFRIPVYV